MFCIANTEGNPAIYIIILTIIAYLGFGYLYKFVMFISYFFQKAENNRFKKKQVDQNFAILFFIFV